MHATKSLTSAHREQSIFFRSVVASLLLLGGITLSITNPSRLDYMEYASSQLPSSFRKECDRMDGQDIRLNAFVFSVPFGDICDLTSSGFYVASDIVIKPMINQCTKPQKNYIVFSIYTTKIPMIGTFKTIAIGGQFITFKEESVG